jgi:hypothetical protein
MRQIAWTLIAHVVLLAIVVYPANWVHFTWRYQLAFATYAVLGVFELEHHYFWVIVSMSAVVMMTVLLMSYSDCGVFETAYATVPTGAYIGGDFALHWLPSLLAVALVPIARIPTDPAIVINSVCATTVILFEWLYFHNPWAVYGCSLPDWISTFAAYALLMLILALILRAVRLTPGFAGCAPRASARR